MVTSTPLGTTTGIRPIRDIAGSLPDVSEDFPAYALLLRLLVGHQAGRRRDDRDTEATEHPGQVVLVRIHAQPWLGHALETRDRALPGRPELQRDHQVLANLGVLHLPARDVTLLLQDLGDVRLDLGGRHVHGVVVRRVGIAYPGQHVCDRVGHGHGLVALLTAVSLLSLVLFATSGPAAWSVGTGRSPGLVVLAGHRSAHAPPGGGAF